MDEVKFTIYKGVWDKIFASKYIYAKVSCVK